MLACRARLLVPVVFACVQLACAEPTAQPRPTMMPPPQPQPVAPLAQPAPPPQPEPEAGNVSLSSAFMIGGEMPPKERDRIADEVSRAIAAQIGLFRQCYARGLKRNPSLSGEVNVEFVLHPDASFALLRPGAATLQDQDVADCTVEAFRKLAMPHPPGDFSMSAPMQFRP